jgi:formylglycine-generating enzyme required for sulfatase activity
MSGNVWEWTNAQVLRVGSFAYDYLSARCAFRGRFNPSPWLNFGGFRVVVSP